MGTLSNNIVILKQEFLVISYKIFQDPPIKKKKTFTLNKKKTNFMAPFYGWGSTASKLQLLRGGSLLFTTKFPEIPGTHYQPQKDERLS